MDIYKKKVSWYQLLKLDIQKANKSFENEGTLKMKTLWKGRHFEKVLTLWKKKSKKKSSKSPWLTSNLNVDYQDKKKCHLV